MSFRKNLRLILKKHNAIATYKNVNKFSSMIKLGKDPQKEMDNSSIVCVYKINCKNCEDNYIGQSKRCLRIRKNEHKRDLNS